MTHGVGIGLSQRFYESLVAPILQQHFPKLPHAAARIGLGSEVLGSDTDMSADHDYGPCVQIFLPEAEFSETAREICGSWTSTCPIDSTAGQFATPPMSVRPLQMPEQVCWDQNTVLNYIHCRLGAIAFSAGSLQLTSPRTIGFPHPEQLF